MAHFLQKKMYFLKSDKIQANSEMLVQQKKIALKKRQNV